MSSNYQRRPSSIAELAQKARNHVLRENQGLKYYLKHAESNRRDGIRLAELGDMEAAFVALARTASLVLEVLPAHPDYKTMLDDTQRSNLNMNGQEILDNLGQLKARISDRYEAYRKDHPEVEESHQQALQAQAVYESQNGRREAMYREPSPSPTDIAAREHILQEAHERASQLSEQVSQMRLTEPQYNARSLPTPNLVSAMSSAHQAARIGGPREQRESVIPTAAHDPRRVQDAISNARAAAATVPSYVPMPAPPPQSSAYPDDYRNLPEAPIIPREQFVGPPMMPLESPTKYDGDSTDSETPYRGHRSTSSVRSPPFPTPITPSIHRGQIQYPDIMNKHQKVQGYAPPDHPMLIPQPTPLHYPSIHAPSTSQSRIHSSAPPLPQPPIRVKSPDPPNLPGLKTVILPRDTLRRFLHIASVNTNRNRETCGLLLGREVRGKFIVSTLLIPKQHSTSDTCTMDEEELVMQFTEERNLITLGWIHTHPTQSCFMSSVDLHTHCAFQRMLPESFAVVCAPKSTPNFGIFRLTDPPGLELITNCKAKEAFHPHPDQPIYTDADKGHVQMRDAALEIVDLR